MVKSLFKKLIGREKLSFAELLTVLFEVENVLNNSSQCFAYHDDDVFAVFTSNCLLYGRSLRDLWDRKISLQNAVEHFWWVLYQEY